MTPAPNPRPTGDTQNSHPVIDEWPPTDDWGSRRDPTTPVDPSEGQTAPVAWNGPLGVGLAIAAVVVFLAVVIGLAARRR